MSSPRTLPFCSGDISNAKVMVIGHDPRLRRSDTVATYALFADYFFRPVPIKASEKAKYQLAEALFSYIGILTCFHYPAYQIAVTNLCNNALPHAPKGKTVLIPQEEAAVGLAEIEDILSNSNIELVFPMSLQVNYWLQQLVFFSGPEEFLQAAQPTHRGVESKPPYYQPSAARAFTLVCGHRFKTRDGRDVYPVLHVKNWPLREPFKRAYKDAYLLCINQIKERLSNLRS